jgi:hypothetical protein
MKFQQLVAFLLPNFQTASQFIISRDNKVQQNLEIAGVFVDNNNEDFV